MVRVAEAGVLVERDLAVEGEDLAVFGEHERVDLDERRVLALVDLVELHDHGGDLVDELGGEATGGRDLLGLLEVDARDRVDLDLGEGLGALDCELLDLHAALDAAQREVGAVGAVEQHREVELLRDAGARATITRLTMWPLMSRPRIASAAVAASSGLCTTLTPPALPRPPALTCALTTTVPPIFSAAAFASSGVSAMMPASTGTP